MKRVPMDLALQWCGALFACGALALYAARVVMPSSATAQAGESIALRAKLAAIDHVLARLEARPPLEAVSAGPKSAPASAGQPASDAGILELERKIAELDALLIEREALGANVVSAALTPESTFAKGLIERGRRGFFDTQGSLESRFRSIELLCLFGSEHDALQGLMPEMEHLLNLSQPDELRGFLGSVRESGVPELVGPLLALETNTQDEKVRVDIVRVLRGIRTPEALEGLKRIANGKSSTAQRKARAFASGENKDMRRLKDG